MTGEREGAVDAGRIVEEIRARVAERKASGLYTDREIAEISSMELRLREHEGYGVEADRLISWLHAHWEATGPLYLEEVRPARPFREAAKRAVRRLLSPLSRILLGQQNQINARLVQLLSGTIPALRQDCRDLEERVESLSLSAEKEKELLAEKLRQLSARVEELEREAAGKRGPGGG